MHVSGHGGVEDVGCELRLTASLPYLKVQSHGIEPWFVFAARLCTSHCICRLWASAESVSVIVDLQVR